MIEDQIKLVIQNLIKLRTHHRDLKKDLSKEKNKALKEVAQLNDLIQAKKDLSAQIQDLKQKTEEDLNAADFYKETREDVLKKEEEMEQEKGKLFELIEKLGKNKPVEMKVECDDGSFAKFQMIPGPRVYINGREEKQD